MTTEIKEILEYPTIYNFDDEPYLHGTDYVKLRDYITNLQQENERLKVQLNGCDELLDNDVEIIDKYKTRIDKAIEYLTDEKRELIEDCYYKVCELVETEDLLNILNGSDENE